MSTPYRKLHKARIEIVERDMGMPVYYRVETLRSPNQREWGLAGLFLLPIEAQACFDSLIAEHRRAPTHRTLRDWRA